MGACEGTTFGGRDTVRKEVRKEEGEERVRTRCGGEEGKTEGGKEGGSGSEMKVWEIYDQRRLAEGKCREKKLSYCSIHTLHTHNNLRHNHDIPTTGNAMTRTV